MAETGNYVIVRNDRESDPLDEQTIKKVFGNIAGVDIQDHIGGHANRTVFGVESDDALARLTERAEKNGFKVREVSYGEVGAYWHP